MTSLAILSAGAAKGVVTALEADFLAATGAKIRGTFGAVGAIRGKLQAGEPCDVIVLTAAMIDELEQSRELVAGTRESLGRVRTGIAVRAGVALPDIADRDALRKTLLSATAVYVPDPKRATAGIHFVNVLRQLGIDGELLTRLRPFPDGATAMRELALAQEEGLIGCTQITEINYTPGVMLVGPLPAEFELATVYAAAVCGKAGQPDLARRFVELLCGPESRALRLQGGFEC